MKRNWRLNKRITKDERFVLIGVLRLLREGMSVEKAVQAAKTYQDGKR